MQLLPNSLASRRGCTTKLARREENIGAVSVNLTSDDLREIESGVSKITVQGARYPENLQKMVGR